MFGFKLAPENEIAAQEVIKQMNETCVNVGELQLNVDSSFLILRDGTSEAEKYKKEKLVLGAIGSPSGGQFLIFIA